MDYVSLVLEARQRDLDTIQQYGIICFMEKGKKRIGVGAWIFLSVMAIITTYLVLVAIAAAQKKSQTIDIGSSNQELQSCISQNVAPYEADVDPTAAMVQAEQVALSTCEAQYPTN